MLIATAKIFQSGNSPALRLPKAFRLKAKTVKLVKLPDGFSVHDDAARARRIKAFAAHALALRATLVTRNMREFARVPGLIRRELADRLAANRAKGPRDHSTIALTGIDRGMLT